jgi:NADH:ubiquinone oxidoreductase subunit B-like Fe-S oxidoreductase
MLSVIIGIIAMAAGVILLIVSTGGSFLNFWGNFVTVVSGCIPPALFFGGLLGLIIGINDIKDKIAEKKEALEEEKEEEKEKEKEEKIEEKKEEEKKEE